jgi:hypothetical protein
MISKLMWCKNGFDMFSIFFSINFPSKSFVSVAESKKSQHEERRVEAPPAVQQQPQPSRLQQQRPPTKVQKTTPKGKLEKCNEINVILM